MNLQSLSFKFIFSVFLVTSFAGCTYISSTPSGQSISNHELTLPKTNKSTLEENKQKTPVVPQLFPETILVDSVPVTIEYLNKDDALKSWDNENKKHLSQNIVIKKPSVFNVSMINKEGPCSGEEQKDFQQKDYQIIKNIFDTRSTENVVIHDNTCGIWSPYVFAVNDFLPYKYLESRDASFRGIGYFVSASSQNSFDSISLYYRIILMNKEKNIILISSLDLTDIGEKAGIIVPYDTLINMSVEQVDLNQQKQKALEYVKNAKNLEKFDLKKRLNDMELITTSVHIGSL